MAAKTFDVRILMTVVKTYRVEAEDEDRAIEEAHQICTPRFEADNPEEDYNEETLSCVVVG